MTSDAFQALDTILLKQVTGGLKLPTQATPERGAAPVKSVKAKLR